MTGTLAPFLSPDALLPADAAYFARTDLATTAHLGFTPLNVDAVTTILNGLLGPRPAVRHISGATEAILRALADAGLPVDRDIRTYTTPAEAEARADTLITSGFRLLSPYPLPPGRWPDSAQIVQPALYGRLNAKAGLAALVSPAHLPRREVLTPAAARARPFGGAPLWVKYGGPAATGWGHAVHRVTDAAAWTAALDAIAASGDPADPGPLVVEEDVPVTTCWAVQLGITDAGTAYGGAAEQIFANPGRQSGSLVDPDNPFPAPDLAKQIGEAARAAGFRGIAGLDIGQTDTGQIVVFDPNFRITSSTVQTLFTPAASRRSGLPVSLSAEIATPRPMADIIARLGGPVADGWFLPTRLLDAALLPAAGGRSRVTGFTLGRDRLAAAAAQDRLRAILLP
jgi:hypothetical protein